MSENSVIKIVIDTNIWIRFLIGRALDHLVKDIKSKNIEIYFSNDLHNELFEVMLRPKFKNNIPDSKRTEILEITTEKVKTITPSCTISDCRDEKDNFLLELAVSAKADYIITGDLDLLVLNPFRSIKIIDSIEFEKVLLKKKDSEKNKI